MQKTGNIAKDIFSLRLFSVWSGKKKEQNAINAFLSLPSDAEKCVKDFFEQIRFLKKYLIFEESVVGLPEQILLWEGRGNKRR